MVVPIEIERRFRIVDEVALPALGRGSKIIQCYLPKWRIEIRENSLIFEDGVLISNLPNAASNGIQSLIDGGDLTPRIRIKEGRGFVTVKGPTVDGGRIEWEFEVPHAQVLHLAESWRFPTVIKKRYEVLSEEGLVWEIDFFDGDNAGLVLAEIELPNFNFEFKKPHWLGDEVTDDGRYGSGSLAREPWCDLREDG